MSRFTAAVRFVSFLPGVILVSAFCLIFSPALYATTTAAPQLLPYTVSIVAGGGTYGGATKYTVGNTCGTNTGTTAPTALSTVGDGCLATQVYFSGNAAVADSEGNVFAVDYTNRLIRRVDAHTGIITTVGGATTTAAGAAPTTNPAKGANCSTSDTTHQSADAIGDGCPATEVVLLNPEAIALDAQGNIWFTDYYLGSVREIVKSTGIIQTVVNQSILTPPSFTSNSLTPTAGVGYVGYNANNSTLSTPITGVTAAQGLLYRPYGLAFDKNGNLYIADTYNNVVDVVNLGSATATIAGVSVPAGQITTIAGSGCAHVYETYVYGETATSSSTPVKQAAMSCSSAYGTSNGTSPYPSTGAGLDNPYQVAVDNSGNIYIADEYPYDVRVINGATGDISTFAGIPGSKTATTVARGVATATKLGSIYGVATDSLGNVYISIFNAYSSSSTAPSQSISYIARVDNATGEIYVIAGQNNGSTTPTANTSQANATYCASTSSLVAVGTGTPDKIGDGCPGLQATFWKPYFPSVDAAGNVYVADQGDALIRKISVGTQFPAVVAGTSVTQSIDVHFGAGDTPVDSSPYTGTFTIPSTFEDFTLGTSTPACTYNSADTTTDCVLQVKFKPVAGDVGLRTAPLTVTSTLKKVSYLSLSGIGLAPALAVDPGTQATLASSSVTIPLTGINSIAIDNGGSVYATVPGTNPVVMISPSGAGSTLSSGSASAGSVTVDGAGNIYVALTNGTLMELPGGVAAKATQIATISSSPAGLAVDAYGNIYVSDSAANTVTEILAGTGAQVVLASQTTSPTLNGPMGLAVDSYGNVFVANTNGNSVIELPFAPDSTPVTLGTGLSSPQGVAIDPAGSLYIADKGNKRIVYIPNESGTLNSNDQIAIITTGLGSPSGVAISANGTIYVSDSANNAIYQFTRSAATINFPSPEKTALGSTPAETSNPVAADIISMGNQTATFGSNFWTASGDSGDFVLTPSSYPGAPEFPNAGYGVSLSASFTPTAIGNRSATYTYNSTTPVTQPTLILNGTGASPTNATTTTITATTPSGGWVYGDTVSVNVTVTVNPGQPPPTPVPTGNVSVYVDGNAPFTETLTPGTTSSTLANPVQISGLGAGPHSIYVVYGGDSESVTSTSNTLSPSFAQAPLTVTVNPVSINFGAPIPNPITTATLSGVENGDSIGLTYSTTAVAGSPVGQYLISVSQVSGTANNYTVTIALNGPGNVAGGTLTISKDNTVTALGVSATSINNSQQVILTATVSSVYNYAVVTVPTGTVTFFNTVGGVQTQIGTAQPVNSSGVATLTTTFTVVGALTSNSVTAVYQGDGNFVTSTSAPVAVVSGAPTFTAVSGAGTNSQLTIQPGQSGLMSFTLTPMYGYNGTITFSCTSPSTTVTCSFSPNPYSPNGSSAPVLVTVTFNTTATVNTYSRNHGPSGIMGLGKLPFSLAALPGLALLCGFSRLRRRFLRGYRYLLFFALCLIGLGFSGCGGGKITPGTPAGTESITIVATGSGFTGYPNVVTQQFNVSLIVQ